MLGPSSPPCLLFLPLPLKSCTEMYMALMFALYPTCKAIIIHPSWQSQALSLLHLQLFALGYDMTVWLISSLLHIAPRVSLFFLLSDHALRSNPTLVWRTGEYFTSSPVWHLCRFDLLGAFEGNSRNSRAKNECWCLTNFSSQVCFIVLWCCCFFLFLLALLRTTALTESSMK